MNEPRVPLGESDRDARPNYSAFAGEQADSSSGHQIGTGVPRPRITGNRNGGIDPLYRDPQSWHSRRDYPECVKDDATTPESTKPDTSSEDDESEQIEPDGPTYLASPDRAYPYSERLYAAWWVWLLPLVAAALLASSIHIGYSALPGWLPYVVLLPVAVLTMLAVSRTKVVVATIEQEPELQVGQARLPLRFIGSVEIIERDRKQAALGPEFDPAAFLTHHASIGPVLRLELIDPEDETPYWVVSTRRPAQLATALGVDTTAAE